MNAFSFMQKYFCYRRYSDGEYYVGRVKASDRYSRIIFAKPNCLIDVECCRHLARRLFRVNGHTITNSFYRVELDTSV